MRIFLDDVACERIEADTIAQAIDAAATLARARGRTIIDVHVDGRRWDSQEIASPQAKHGATELRLVSADPNLVVAEAFADAADTLNEINQLQQSAAQSLQADRTGEAMDRLGRAIDLWGSVHQAVTMGAAMANLDLSPQQSVIQRLSDQLRSMRAALERRDVVALADTLMYDLPDVVIEWRALLHTLRERVLGSTAKGGRKA